MRYLAMYEPGTLICVDRVVEFQKWIPHAGGCAYEYSELSPGTPILITGYLDDHSWTHKAVVGEMKGAVMARDIMPRKVTIVRVA